jgi:hypothetical protein
MTRWLLMCSAGHCTCAATSYPAASRRRWATWPLCGEWARAPRVYRWVCLSVGAACSAVHAVVVRSVGCAMRLRLRSTSCWRDGLAFVWLLLVFFASALSLKLASAAYCVKLVRRVLSSLFVLLVWVRKAPRCDCFRVAVCPCLLSSPALYSFALSGISWSHIQHVRIMIAVVLLMCACVCVCVRVPDNDCNGVSLHYGSLLLGAD